MRGGIQHAKMNKKIQKECYKWVRAILRTELNAKNKLEAINTLVRPVVTYSFNVINYNLAERRQMDRNIQKLLTLNRMHHPETDVKVACRVQLWKKSILSKQ